jgi:hypothetical protein
MSPLSVLPGRIRYETDRLIGCKEGSALFEESILAAKGVIEASASYRTGRVLVRFDEGLVKRSDIEGYLDRALLTALTVAENGSDTPSPRRKVPASEVSSFSTGFFVKEMALHALLPSPLDLLVPAAASLFRR